MKNKQSILLSLIFILLASVAASAQDFWMTKSYARWDEKEIEKMLNDSPWAQSQKIRVQIEGRVNAAAGSVVGNVSLAPTIGNTVNNSSTAPTIDYTYTLRLRSAVPIRQAIVRKNALNQKEPNRKQLEEFEKRQSGILACPACQDNYVVTLSAKSNENKNYDPVYEFFGKARFEDLKRYVVLLNDKGKKRELVHFIQPKTAGDEAVFFFPRSDAQGNPLFTAESKELIFNATNNQISQATNFKMKIAPMIIDGKIEF